MKIEVFEESENSGLRSPSPDFAERQFLAGLRWLESKGVKVQRRTIAEGDSVLSENDPVETAIELQGLDCLPITVLDGAIIGVSGYPSRMELLILAGYQASEDPGFVHERTVLTTSMGAALANNDLDQFRVHYRGACALGIPAQDLRNAVKEIVNRTGGTIQAETLTKLEQFLAFGPSGERKLPRCSCGGG